MWSDYFLFVLKTLTLLIALSMFIGALIRASRQSPGEGAEGKLTITRLNKVYESVKLHMQAEILDKKALKKELKQVKARQKENAKSDQARANAYWLKFKGDIHASEVAALRREVTAILTTAQPGEEVVVSIESPGGAVSGYGLAASQLLRLKDHGLKLTACVDKVAASGGYLMAAVADRIYAAPFSIVGSIGVISQVPNVHRLLKRLDVDVDVLTAGKHKAPLTLLGKNTEEGKQKHLANLNAIHQRFKALVDLHREQLDIDEVSEGDFWLAEDALALKLVDEISTSDAYLMKLCDVATVYRVLWKPRQSIELRIKNATSSFFSALETGLFKRLWP